MQYIYLLENTTTVITRKTKIIISTGSYPSVISAHTSCPVVNSQTALDAVWMFLKGFLGVKEH